MSVVRTKCAPLARESRPRRTKQLWPQCRYCRYSLCQPQAPDLQSRADFDAIVNALLERVLVQAVAWAPGTG